MTFELATTLSEPEQQFLYNLEVLGLPQARAAEMAGLTGAPHDVLKRPHIVSAREQVKAATRARVNITKDDVVRGYQDAIGQAVLLSDPMAQIAGWREIAKILGYDGAKEVHLHLNGDVKQVRRQIAQLNDNELVKLLEADNVIDGDFYVAKEHADH